MNTPANLKYTKSDEWFDPASGKMGLSDYAQSQLSDIVFVELLVEIGDTVKEGDSEKRVLNVVDTEAAKEKLTKIKTAFQNWIWLRTASPKDTSCAAACSES